MTWDAEPRPLTDEAVRAAAEAALAHGGRGGLDVDVVFVDGATLTDLHARFLDDPSPTDVITFDLGEDGHGPAGELYVSVERAVDVAAQRGVQPGRELALYVVHGALHLCGLDDATVAERTAMRSAERAVMQALGYDADDLAHDEGA